MKIPSRSVFHRSLDPNAEAPTTKAESRYEFKALSGGTIEMLIYGQIYDTAWTEDMIGADRIARDLAANPNASSITLKINSPGGNMFAGNAIYNTLKAHAASVTVYIDGLAASAASIIAMAGDKVVMYRNSAMMIHEPGGYVDGNRRDVRKTADALDKLTEAFGTAYQDKTGLDAETVATLMEAETWFTPSEAVEQGFADEIDDHQAVSVTADGSRLSFNGLALETKAFKNVPQALLVSASHKDPTPKPGQSTEVTMKIKAFFAALRRNFGAAMHPRLNQDLDAAEGQMADDASAEEVANRITAIFQTALDTAQALVAPLAQAGITSVDAVADLLANAEYGKKFREGVITAMMEAGVRARGDEFDKPRYERFVASATLEDITAQTKEFDAEAQAKLGGGGRQTTPKEPGKEVADAAAAAEDKEVKGETDAVQAFLKRTGAKKPSA